MQGSFGQMAPKRDNRLTRKAHAKAQRRKGRRESRKHENTKKLLGFVLSCFRDSHRVFFASLRLCVSYFSARSRIFNPFLPPNGVILHRQSILSSFQPLPIIRLEAPAAVSLGSLDFGKLLRLLRGSRSCRVASSGSCCREAAGVAKRLQRAQKSWRHKCYKSGNKAYSLGLQHLRFR